MTDVLPPTRTMDASDLYRVSSKGPELVVVPPVSYLMVDGHGDPNTADEYRDAVEALYAVSYALKFDLKKELGVNPKVDPLEGLWWTDDMANFSIDRKADWNWTSRIAQPAQVDQARFERVRSVVGRKKELRSLGRLRLAILDEGLSAQVLHVGPFSAEGPTVAALHEFIDKSGGLVDPERHRHHEIYLTEQRRTAADKLRTIIRQPFSWDGDRDR